MLPQDMQESVITASGSLRHVTFRINARKPGNSDFDKVKTLKKVYLSKVKEPSVEMVRLRSSSTPVDAEAWPPMSKSHRV